MRPTAPSISLLVALSAAVLAGCGTAHTRANAGPTVPSSTSPPPLAFATAPPSAVGGNTVSFDLAASGVRIVPADGDTSGASGHYHIFIDRNPPPPGAPIPKEPGITHTADSHVTLSGLTMGSHHISVVLGDGAHRRLGTALLEADVAVEGPSVTATAPATVAPGDPVHIHIGVEGVTLAPADGDTSGRTGHLHLFVDRNPTPAGQPIPKEDGIVHTTDTAVTLPPMAPGEHTVWVVMGNGAHVPLDPPVMAKVTFTVAA